MNDKELITQLKSLKNIHPDKDWVILTRNNLVGAASTRLGEAGAKANPRFSISHLLDLNFFVPRPVAVSVLGLIVVVAFTASFMNYGLIEDETGSDFASVSRYGAISNDTVQELREIVDDVRGPTPSGGTTPTDYTVIFNEDSDERENFKDALRNRIESKIGFYNDLFAQLNDGDASREISLNSRREELSFKLAYEDAAAQSQIEKLLEDAQAALDEGNLIDALDLVVAIDKLLK